MSLRVAVIGNDVSAFAFAAFLKHKRPASVIHIFPQSKNILSDIPLEGVTFSSPWIRNDPKGRSAIMRLGRDILGIGQKEFVVSNVGNSSKFKIGSPAAGWSAIPSFSAVVRNMASIGLEPLRRCRFNKEADVSVEAFIGDRFGPRFARRYGDTIAQILTGRSDSSSVSAHGVIGKMIKNLFIHKSVLLGPLVGMFSKVRSGRNTVDVMDYLWQELMTGGKQVTFTNRLDLSLFREALIDHTKSTRDMSVHDGGVTGVDFTGKDVSVTTDDGDTVPVDLVVTSAAPSSVWGWTQPAGQDPPQWVHTLGESTRIFSTRFVWSVSRSTSAKLVGKHTATYWSTAGSSETTGIIGVVFPSMLFPSENGEFIVDVLSNCEVSDDALIEYLSSCGSVVHTIVTAAAPVRRVTTVEDIPVTRMGHSAALYEFNQHRLTTTRSRMQILGKWYYCPNGSVSDIVSDAERVADLVTDRYESFPKRIENERPDDWINRNDKSLDFQYTTDTITRGSRISL